jgi:transcriptional/translational regulatory protein YebC/TACO1
LFAGHNRWSQIKHDKAKNDKAKSRERQAIAKEISSATQSAYLTPSLPTVNAC